MKFQWKNAVVLTVVCALVGAVVALSYAKTAPLIERHAAEAAESARRGLFPEAECFEELDADAAFPLESCCAVLQGGRLIGYTGQLTVNGSSGNGLIAFRIGSETATGSSSGATRTIFTRRRLRGNARTASRLFSPEASMRNFPPSKAATCASIDI